MAGVDVKWIVCKATTGEVIAELPDLEIPQVSDGLMAYSTSAAKLYTANMDADTLPYVVQSMAVTYVLLEDGLPTWGGVLTRALARAEYFDLTLATVPAYFRRRYVGDETFAATDQCEIAASLVEAYAADSLAMNVDFEPSATTRDRTYTDIGDKRLFDALSELAGVEGGPEWCVLWTETMVGDKQGFMPTFYAADRIGSDPVGDLKPAVTFDLPGNIRDFQFLEDFGDGEGANYIIATSTADANTRPQSVPATPAEPDGRLKVEYRFTPSTSITETETLDAHAAAALARMGSGTRALEVEAEVTATTQPGREYVLGDQVGFVIAASSLPLGLKGTARVVGWSRMFGSVERIKPVLSDLTLEA